MIHIANAADSATLNGILARRFFRYLAPVLVGAMVAIGSVQAQSPSFDAFAVPSGSAPHDVAPAPDESGTPRRRKAQSDGWTRAAARSTGSRSATGRHRGVIIGPDRAAWITDGGLNSIVRVDPKTLAVTHFPLPKDRQNANLNTAVFDKRGHLWFTGQGGI